MVAADGHMALLADELNTLAGLIRREQIKETKIRR